MQPRHLRRCPPSRHQGSLAAAVSGAGLMALALLGLPGQLEARPMGGARARPYPEAVAVTQRAAQAVLDRGGTESCLRGKLTNALLGLSASCGAAGERNALCDLADSAVVQLHWPLAFMDDTSRQLLDLIEDPGRGPGGEAVSNAAVSDAAGSNAALARAAASSDVQSCEADWQP